MGMDQGRPRMRCNHHAAFKRPRRESGAIAIMAVGAIIIICGFCSLALDLSRVYNRKVELQSAADAAAVSAATELDGTKAGLTRATQRVASLFATPVMYGGPSYGYIPEPMDWSDDAIKFAASPNGPWLSSSEAAAKSVPNGLLFVQIDTRGLDLSYGEVQTLFLPVVSNGGAITSTAARAVAGPSAVGVMPFGICAMDPVEKRDRNGELQEYGFRRGVSYDLMQLNPEDTETGQTFLIHPFTGPGTAPTSSSDFNTVAPAVCTGVMGMARVTGAKVSVSSPFPLNDYYRQFNSRFDSYTEPCSPATAPPDRNVKEYSAKNGSVTWMETDLKERQAAKVYEDSDNKKRTTVAGPSPSPASTADEFGPLWSYAKAVRYANPMPSSGYVAFPTSSWKDLYPAGPPQAKSSYPSSTPYQTAGPNHGQTPTNPGVQNRRVLNIPLLSCPVSENRATVKGIGRFFMTVKADDTHLYAEFAGLAEEQTLRTRVRLYP
ncbi:pilus assembly protein TadG-related protein [Massilia sp. BSC265]|uniref:pilus assembly protein TadG-related protein n=1 Tax=Massilia sp. BSC265 TaxID=1549812 RepID=UPI00068AEE5B|nr:pilus assembly protein TadG-related protein [Massilia sp. BSC265]